jgi:hypothetical protein
MRRALLILLILCGVPGHGVAATLKGKVLDGSGNPVPSLALSVVGSSPAVEYVVRTNEQGAFTQSIEAGLYTISLPGSTSEVILIRVESSEERNLVLQSDDKGLLALSTSISMAPPETPESDPSLAQIRDYEVQLEPDETVVRQTKASVDLVNPFPAQKGGRFHGSVYWFHRNDNFDARNFFDPVGEPLPEYKRNQFGVSLAATLKKNINLLGTFEGLRIIQGSTLLSHVPTTAMKNGDFSGLTQQLVDPVTRVPFEGNRVPETRIHPVSRGLLSLLPDPNRSDLDRNYVNSNPTVRDRNTWSFRMDHQLAGGSNYVARYWMSDGSDFFVQPLPSFGSRRSGRDQEGGFSHTQKISNRLVATGRLGFSRNTSFLSSVNAGQSGLLASVGIAGLEVADPADEGYPDFRLSGYASFGDAGLPVSATLNRYDFEAGITYTPANHSIRVGGALNAYQANDNQSDSLRRGRFSFNGYYTGDAFADFLLGVPDTASRAIGSDRLDLRRKSWSLYARDDWKLGSRLSLSWGLTYNYFQPFRSLHDNISGFYPLLFEPPITGEIVQAGSERANELGLGPAGEGGMVFPDRNDLAPSFGIAYRPTGSNRLVLRGAYSVGYNPLGRDYFVSYLGRNYPYYYTQTSLSPIDQALIDLSTPFETEVPLELSVRGIETQLRTSYIHYWQAGVQNEIVRQWNVELWYQGSKGVHMPRVLAANVPLPGPGEVQPRRPNPDYGRFNILTGGAAYTRHSFDAALERRLADGLSVKSGFDWQRTMSDIFYGNPSNPRDLAGERAASDYPPSMQFFLNYIVDLPFGKTGRFGRDIPPVGRELISGWRLSGITQVQGGSRFSVVASGDPNSDGVPDDRPDRIGPGTLDSSRRSIDAWFATGDFASPSPYSFGNSGRNILLGPAYVNWDLSVIKQTRFSDGNLVELRVELFNAFNQVNFESPNAVYGTSVFGKVFGAHRAREIEVALRYSF